MSFFDYFRKFFGIKHHNEPGTSGLGDSYTHKDSFRNPIWQNDEDDDDIDDFRHPRRGIHFNIFTDALEMTRYFESQMDNLLKSFFYDVPFQSLPFSEHGDVKALPFAIPKKEGNLRDEMLKFEPNFSISPKSDFFSTNIAVEEKRDADLDGKITKEEFSKMWNNGNMETVTPSSPRVFSFGRSVRKEIIRRPDGTIEQKQITKDNEGNEETIVSRGIGDKKHVITIKKDKSGVETKSEDLINISENELEDFNKKWKPSIENNVDGQNSMDLNYFPWEKFFGYNPKL